VTSPIRVRAVTMPLAFAQAALAIGASAFDPGAIEALDRHDVFLTPDEAVFVFESHLGSDALAPLLSDPKLWEAVSTWGEHVAGPPRIAEEAFSWSRSEAADNVSFLPTPGPGDSDGGDIY